MLFKTNHSCTAFMSLANSKYNLLSLNIFLVDVPLFIYSFNNYVLLIALIFAELYMKHYPLPLNFQSYLGNKINKYNTLESESVLIACGSGWVFSLVIGPMVVSDRNPTKLLSNLVTKQAFICPEK